MFDLMFSLVALTVFSGTGYSIIKTTQAKDLSDLEKFLLSFALGFGIFGTVIFAMGVLGIVGFVCLFSIFLGGAMLSVKNISFLADSFYGAVRFILDIRPSFFTGLLLSTAFLFFLLNTFISITPIYSIDSITYHFTLPRMYLESGKIVDVQGYLFAHLPQHSEMINLFFMGLKSDTSAKIFSSFFGFMCFLLLFSAAKRYFGQNVALVSASLFYSSSFTTWVTAKSFVEPQWTFLSLLSIYLIVLFFEKRSSVYLFLSAIMLGFSFSCKFLTFYYFIIIGVFFLYKTLSRKNPSCLKDYAIWLSIVCICGCPWYVYNLITTGNPFFPLFFETLGGRGWSEGTNRILIDFMRSFGKGYSFVSFINLPFTLTFKGMSFFQGHLIGPLILCFAPFALANRIHRKKIIFLYAAAFIYLTLWFSGSQQSRFIFPIMPFLALLAAMGFLELDRLPKKWISLFSKFIIILFMISSLRITLLHAGQCYKVIIGAEDKDTFLCKMAPDYGADLWMNKNLKPKDKVLFLGFGQYYLDIPYLVGGYGIQGTLDYSVIKSADELYSKVRALGVTHVYNLDQYMFVRPIPHLHDFTLKYLEPVFEDKSVLISKSPLSGGSRVVGTVYRLK